jgi:hypothetical protein
MNMKKILSIAGVFLFFLIILGLLLVKILFPTTEPEPINDGDPFGTIVLPTQQIETGDPITVVTSCYKWYLQVSNQGAAVQDIATRREAQTCFSPEFIELWEAPDLDYIPALQSQDILPSWLDHITASIVGQSVNSVDAEVRLGEGEELQTLTVHLNRTQEGMWKISSVELPE